MTSLPKNNGLLIHISNDPPITHIIVINKLLLRMHDRCDGECFIHFNEVQGSSRMFLMERDVETLDEICYHAHECCRIVAHSVLKVQEDVIPPSLFVVVTREHQT